MQEKFDSNDWERGSARARAEVDGYDERGEAGEAEFRERIAARGRVAARKAGRPLRTGPHLPR